MRDPGGQVVHLGGRVLRFATADAAADLEALFRSGLYAELCRQGHIVRTTEFRGVAPDLDPEQAIPSAAAYNRVFEHEVIPFRSYPYEWPGDMLKAAGELQLDIALRALPAGRGLKDATPFNVLFRGPKPVFVDVLSLEQRDSTDPIWLPYAQFARMFLLPLVAMREFSLEPRQAYANPGRGLEPGQVYAMASPLTRLKPVVFAHATMPHLLTARADKRSLELGRPRRVSTEQARFVLTALFRRLKSHLRRAWRDSPQRSPWSAYGTESHTPRYHEAKAAAVVNILEKHAPRWVLDIGCNTGRHALAAAERGASVVAIDSDPIVVGELWKSAAMSSADVLPLVVDITHPSPASGWRNREWPSFLERSERRFDCVLMLGLAHHVRASGVPVEGLLEIAHRLTTRVVVMEWVPRSDRMFQAIAAQRLALYADMDRDAFESVMRRSFAVLDIVPLAGSERALYVLEKR